jgi:hypothetical protein
MTLTGSGEAVRGPISGKGARCYPGMVKLSEFMVVVRVKGVVRSLAKSGKYLLFFLPFWLTNWGRYNMFFIMLRFGNYLFNRPPA